MFAFLVILWNKVVLLVSKYIYLLVFFAAAIENSPLLFLAFSRQYNIKILLFAIMSALLIDMSIILILKFFSKKAIAFFGIDKESKSWHSAKRYTLFFAIFYRFIPFARLPVLFLTSSLYSLFENFILNIIGALLWPTSIYFFIPQIRHFLKFILK